MTQVGQSPEISWGDALHFINDYLLLPLGVFVGVAMLFKQTLFDRQRQAHLCVEYLEGDALKARAADSAAFDQVVLAFTLTPNGRSAADFGG